MIKNLLSFCLCLFALNVSFAQVLIEDNFDNYVLGALTPQASHWDTWTPGSTSEQGEVSNDIAYSGSHSFKTAGQGGPADVLLLLGNQTSGNFRLEFKLYIPTGNAAYFNHQKDQTAPGSFWGQEIYFEIGGNGDMDAGASSAAQFSFPHDQWMNVIQFFDLDNDRTSLIIDNQLVHSWPLNESSQGTSNGTLQLGAFDFYARGSSPHLFYIDDVKFTQLAPNPSATAILGLHLDMTKTLVDGGTISADGVHVAGGFNNWTPDSTMMMDNGDSTYSQFVEITQFTTAKYKFLNGNAWGVDESVPSDCGIDNGQGGYNRAVDVFFEDTAMAIVCLGYCVGCDSVTVGTDELSILENGVKLFPNPAVGQTQLEFNLEYPTDLTINVSNSIGQVVVSKQLNQVTQEVYQLSLNQLNTGMYFIQITDGEHQTIKKLIVQE